MKSILSLPLACVLAAVLMTGCYEEAAPTTSTPPPAPSSVQSRTTISGGGSSLGKAKDAASSVVDLANQHSQQVADQADLLNED